MRKSWLILCNCQSLLYKIDELRSFVCATKPLFICLTETWLTPDINSDVMSIKGYKTFRNDRQDNTLDSRRGGGSMIYVSMSLKSESINFPAVILKPQGIECNMIKFVDTDLSLAFLICIYIPPGLKSDNFLLVVKYVSDCMDFILFEYPESDIYVCGDFNRYDMSFLTTDYDLQNTVDVPTFGNVTLDKLFCPCNLRQFFQAVTAPGLGSAVHSHNIVVINRICESNDVNDVNFHKVFDLRKSFVMSFYNTLKMADWSFFANCFDVEQCAHLF